MPFQTAACISGSPSGGWGSSILHSTSTQFIFHEKDQIGKIGTTPFPSQQKFHNKRIIVSKIALVYTSI